MTNYVSPDKQSIDQQIAEIASLFDMSKLMGCTLSGLFVKELSDELDEHCLLCIFQDCTNGVVRGDAGVPVFPAFYGREVAFELVKRELCEIVDYDQRHDVNRYFVRFSDSWI